MKRIVELPRSVAKPCPFCGDQPHIETWPGGGRDRRVVSCQSDYCWPSPRVFGGSRRVAIKRWNTRS